MKYVIAYLRKYSSPAHVVFLVIAGFLLLFKGKEFAPDFYSLGLHYFAFAMAIIEIIVLATMPKPVLEEAVIISFALSADSKDGIKKVHALEDKLGKILEPAELGDVDGDEFGDDEVTIYVYGPNAAKIYDAVESTLKSAEFKPVRVVVRHGAADDSEAKEEKHVLT